MALFDDASLVVTPNGYKAGTLYSIKPTSGAGDMTVVRATTATRVNSAGLIESMANNVPRLDYLNASCPSLLLEPQRSNLVLYSEQLDNGAWNKTNTTLTANAALSPDGYINADELFFTASGGFHLIDQSVSLTSGTTYTQSYFVKDNGQNFVQIYTSGVMGTTDYVNFNLTNGSISDSLGITGEIVNYGNGWYRISATKTASSTGNGLLPIAGIPTATSVRRPSYTGSGQSIYLWGAQLEAGSYPTSYIPTTTAAVTRNADEISKTGISALIGQTEGTIFIDFDIDNILSQTIDPVIFSFSGTNYIRLFTTGQINYFESNSVFVASSVGIINNGQNKIAVNYKNNDFSIYANGVLVGSNNSGAVVAKSQIGLYYLPNTAFNPSLFYNLVTLFPTKLTGAECISLTT
jgi:hypothetical protein